MARVVASASLAGRRGATARGEEGAHVQASHGEEWVRVHEGGESRRRDAT